MCKEGITVDGFCKAMGVGLNEIFILDGKGYFLDERGICLVSTNKPSDIGLNTFVELSRNKLNLCELFGVSEDEDFKLSKHTTGYYKIQNNTLYYFLKGYSLLETSVSINDLFFMEEKLREILGQLDSLDTSIEAIV